MIYQHVFSLDSSMHLEYAYKLYEYIKNTDIKVYYYCYNKNLKYDLIKLGIDEDLIVCSFRKDDIVVNQFSNYRFVKSLNFYKIAYGYGGINWLYKSIKYHICKRNAYYLCASEFEKERLGHPKANNVIGVCKYDTHYELPSDIQIPLDKPIVLFLHTWDKCNSKFETFHRYVLGLSDFEHTASVLKKYTDKFTIIHKNHHNTNSIFDNFINIDSGTYDSRKLLDMADIIIADYGGSAVEAIISEKAKILYVNDDRHDKIEQSNLDAMFHNIFHSTSNDNFENSFQKLIEEPLSDEELKLRKCWRNRLFPYLDCGAQNLGKFIENLNNSSNVNDEW